MILKLFSYFLLKFRMQRNIGSRKLERLGQKDQILGQKIQNTIDNL